MASSSDVVALDERGLGLSDDELHDRERFEAAKRAIVQQAVAEKWKELEATIVAHCDPETGAPPAAIDARPLIGKTVRRRLREYVVADQDRGSAVRVERRPRERRARRGGRSTRAGPSDSDPPSRQRSPLTAAERAYLKVEIDRRRRAEIRRCQIRDRALFRDDAGRVRA
jgi:hypothetical protein